MPAMFGAQRVVEGSIDFDGVEKLGEIRGFVKPRRLSRRVHNAGPVGVRPAGGADKDSAIASFLNLVRSRHLNRKPPLYNRLMRVRALRKRLRKMTGRSGFQKHGRGYPFESDQESPSLAAHVRSILFPNWANSAGPLR